MVKTYLILTKIEYVVARALLLFARHLRRTAFVAVQVSNPPTYRGDCFAAQLHTCPPARSASGTVVAGGARESGGSQGHDSHPCNPSHSASVSSISFCTRPDNLLKNIRSHLCFGCLQSGIHQLAFWYWDFPA
jgi:hypothetical protein